MFDDGDPSEPPTPDASMFALAPVDTEWRPILHASNQVVLYNATSHALSIRQRQTPPSENTVIRRDHDPRRCPYCHQSMPTDDSLEEDEAEIEMLDSELEDHPRARVPDYFHLLQVANETASAPPTPASTRGASLPSEGEGSDSQPFRAGTMAEGYFKAFFQEECRLGMGANGSVYLCQHVLDGNPLGHFAVKKIAVGQSHSYLLNILREVRLLEKLHHPNIITYHHAWLESYQFSQHGPRVPTLHVLMQWAEGGSLDDFIDVRLGRASPHKFPHLNSHPSSTQPEGTSMPVAEGEQYSRSARIRAFRALQHAQPEERERLRREMLGQGSQGGNKPAAGDWKAVHLLSAEEVRSLFRDVVEGLAFLHDKSILHLDLKPGNVLLTWDENRLIPRAMLSDFGTSQDMLNSRTRSGNTGTLEYASPESLPSPTGQLYQVDSKSDMWSLGMILHKLLFFRLPYQHASDNPDKTNDSRQDGRETMSLLEKEILSYPGFKNTPALSKNFASRHLPQALLILLENLLHVRPHARPSCERVLVAIRNGNIDPLPASSRNSREQLSQQSSLVPVRRPSPELRKSHSEQPSVPSTSNATELPAWIDEPSAPPDKEEAEEPLLSLPSPLGFEEFSTQPDWVKLRLWNQEFILNARTSRVAMTRTVKSVLLVLKARAISSSYMDSTANVEVLGLAMALAFMDTWSERLSVSAALGLAHLGLIRLATWLH